VLHDKQPLPLSCTDDQMWLSLIPSTAWPQAERQWTENERTLHP